MSTHPYYAEKARDVFGRAGGDPDNAGPLAEWAEQARALGDRAPHGVLVAEDGEILGETVRTRGHASAVYVDDAGSQRWGLFGNEVGLARGQIARRLGGPVVHIPLSAFHGPSRATMQGWTAAECAEHCGIRPSTWRDYVADGRAPAPMPGYDEDRRRRWDAQEVRTWQASRRGQGWRKGSSSK